VAGLSGVALAGCLADGQDTEDGAATPTASNTPQEFADVPIDETAEVPEGITCGVCHMPPAEYPEATAQTTHDDGSRQFFCSPGCAITYHTLPSEFDAPAVHRTWIREFPTQDLVDITELHLVLNELPERGMDPMRNPVPFRNQSEARSYVERFDDLEVSDIATESDLNRSIVLRYRDWYVTRDI
jgi:hypothetical protein